MDEKVMVVNGSGRIVFAGDPKLAEVFVARASRPEQYRVMPLNPVAETSYERMTNDAVTRSLVAQAKIHGSFTLNDVLDATGQQLNANRWNAYYDGVQEGSSNRRWDDVWWQTIKRRKAEVQSRIAA